MTEKEQLCAVVQEFLAEELRPYIGQKLTRDRRAEVGRVLGEAIKAILPLPPPLEIGAIVFEPDGRVTLEIIDRR